VLGIVALLVAGVAGFLASEANDGGEEVTLAGDASGVVERDGGEATLRVTGMEPLSGGDVYQLWFRDGEGVAPSVSFTVAEDGEGEAEIGEIPEGTDELLVTPESEPGLAAPKGEVVLSARFADSTLAYQGYGAGLPILELRAIASVATGGLEPDLTILLDVDPEVGIRRKAPGARNRFESIDLAFHHRVRDGFLELARDEPARWHVVDSSRHIDEVFQDVLALVLDAASVADDQVTGIIPRR
jgi:hypothetical protein